MPYVSKESRKGNYFPRTSGELNFAITTLINSYIASHGLYYGALNDAIGVLECAKLELYRRVVAPYEDTKLKQNGDVYSPELITHD